MNNWSTATQNVVALNNMLLLDRVLGKRDILIPYFDFSTVLHGNVEPFIMREIYKLRYEVYCLERAYLQREDFAEELETDSFDVCSTHFAAWTLKGDMVGTVRLVQPGPQQGYPFEGHCTVFSDFVLPPREQAAEISRLAVKKNFRRRRGDSMEGVSKDFVEKGSTASIKPAAAGRDKRGNGPLLLLGMYREMYRHSRATGIRFWFAAMERSLARSLEKMGFKFVPIGPQIDYYGPVTPYMVDLQDLEQRLQRDNQFLAAWFNDERIPIWIVFKTLIGNWLTRGAPRG